jgi:hypothetical protein
MYEYRYNFDSFCVLTYELTQYEGVSKSLRTESIKKSATTINIRWEVTQRVMAAKLIRLTHKTAIQLHLLAESCIICSSSSRRPVRKLLDTPSYRLTERVIKNNWSPQQTQTEHLLITNIIYKYWGLETGTNGWNGVVLISKSGGG